MKSRISIIAALGKHREIGKDGKLLWHIPDDLKRFKELTLGHPVIMGRKTRESLPQKAKLLPQRTNIVVTRTIPFAQMSGGSALIYANSIREAFEKAKEKSSEIFVIGGAQIYEQALPYADRLYLTLIDDEKDADSFFPSYEHLFQKILHEEKRVTTEGLCYRWVNMGRTGRTD